jgi:hypothetical protein
MRIRRSELSGRPLRAPGAGFGTPLDFAAGPDTADHLLASLRRRLTGDALGTPTPEPRGVGWRPCHRVGPPGLEPGTKGL